MNFKTALLASSVCVVLPAAFILGVVLAGAFILGNRGDATAIPKPLTDGEKFSLRTKQKLAIDAETILHTSQPWLAFQQANQALGQAVTDTFKTRAITNNDFMLCDGPQAPAGLSTNPCSNVKTGDIALVAVPKPPAKPAEAPKKP